MKIRFKVSEEIVKLAEEHSEALHKFASDAANAGVRKGYMLAGVSLILTYLITETMNNLKK